MKRRRRKSKSAVHSSISTIVEAPILSPESARPVQESLNSPKVEREPEIPQSLSEHAASDQATAIYLEFPNDSEMAAPSSEISTDTESAATPSVTSSTAGKPSPISTPLTGADRRIYPRYEFSAAAEVVPTESGPLLETRVRDLSQQGCYVDTGDALPLGTVTDVRIKKGKQLFAASARVVYSRAGKGMGLVFTSIDAERAQILDTWLTESRETSWLAANRRRSQRVLMTIPVLVSGNHGPESPFREEARTRAISAHGSLLLMTAQVRRGQRLTLSNLQTKASLECVVAHIDRRQANLPQVGVEFTLPNPMFWHVAFPPKDWTPRHPDAKVPGKAR
jgi:hypothetical protein